ncbi:MAG: class I SAM-dependent methyltransferase [Myxococcota bacterium]
MKGRSIDPAQGGGAPPDERPVDQASSRPGCTPISSHTARLPTRSSAKLRERDARADRGPRSCRCRRRALLTFARLVGARRAIELGTFTGYSALCIARGLPADGRLLCCDVSREWTDVGRPLWRRAGVEDRIDLHLAPAP